MANSDADNVDALESELSKRDRLVNAWIAAGEDATIETVARLSGASESYASRIGQQMEAGALSDDDVSEAEEPELVEKYRQQLEAGERRQEADEGGGERGEESGERGGEQTGEGRGEAGAGDGEREQPGSEQGAGGRGGGAGYPGQQPPGQPPQQVPGQSPRGDAAESAQGGGRESRPESGRQQQQPPRQSQQPGQETQGRQPPTAQAPGATPPGEAEGYVPVSQLRQVDDALALYEEQAQYEVQHSDPEGQQNQLALAKLYVAQKARTLLGAAAENAVPRDEL